MGVSITRIVKFIRKGDKGDAGANGITISLLPAALTPKVGVRSTLRVQVALYDGGRLIAYNDETDGNMLCSTLPSSSAYRWTFRIERGKFYFVIMLTPTDTTAISLPFTITYKGLKYDSVITIQPIADGAKGDPGEKGDRGPALRGPQAWSDCTVGYVFQSGANGEEFKDVVMYGNNYYSCVKSHTKTADNYPTSTTDTNNGYWKLADKFEIVATKILLAQYALVKNLGVETIDMKDDAGNIIFQAKDGVVTCKTGNFTNVTIESGKIAGFKISGTGLTNNPFTNDAYIIFRNDTHKTFAGIGGNVLPISSGARAVARFENEDTQDWWSLGANYAMILSAKNGERNYAFAGSGNGLLNGWIDGFTFFKVSPTTANTIYDGSLNMYKANRFIVNSSVSNAGVALPKLSHVKMALGIGDQSFCVKIVITADLGSSNFFIYGRNKKKSSSNTYPWNTDELPLMTHWDGSNWDDMSMAEGDTVEFLLIYDTSRTATINSYTTKYTARITNRQN